MEKEKWMNFMKIFFVVLFITYQGGNMLFLHMHNDGSQIVVHSHPYSKCGHNHSCADFHHIHILSLLAAIYSNGWTVERINPALSKFIPYILTNGHIQPKHYCSSSFRAPPAQILI
ncbi:MAG: hypothetical protein PUB21_03210 [Bacteroidales bacterium]|nr:hypothetical protein [Bacteroidales bacterium]